MEGGLPVVDDADVGDADSRGGGGIRDGMGEPPPPPPSVTLPSLGSITYYEDRCAFQTTCFIKAHKGHCAKIRAANGRPSRPQQGRPLGYLLSWLMEGSRFEDAKSHIAWDPRNGEAPSFEARMVSRELAKAEFGAQFAELEQCEVAPSGRGR